MEALGINAGLLFTQMIAVLLVIALPLLSLASLAGKKLPPVPLVLWVILICAIPLLGSLAYWIVRPAAESKV